MNEDKTCMICGKKATVDSQIEGTTLTFCDSCFLKARIFFTNVVKNSKKKYIIETVCEYADSEAVYLLETNSLERALFIVRSLKRDTPDVDLMVKWEAEIGNARGYLNPDYYEIEYDAETDQYYRNDGVTGEIPQAW